MSAPAPQEEGKKPVAVDQSAHINLKAKGQAGKQENAVLTNFEVLDFLRSRGATSDPVGCLGAVAASECKVYDYLIQSAACNQTREIIAVSMKRFEQTKLAKAEKLNIINLRPSTLPEIFPIIDMCDKRLPDNEIKELVELVLEVLPPPPSKPEA